MKATARTCGKINLQLLVGNADTNGYHRLESLFQAVALKETVTVQKTSGASRLDWEFQVPKIIAPSYCPHRDQQAVKNLEIEKNLAYQAVRLVAEKAGYNGGLAIKISKQIPVAGGMAGGSADAGAALLAANKLFGLELERSELAQMGAALGADVPTTIYGGSNFGCRYGDKITVLEDMPLRYWVIAVSPKLLSTPQVFQELARLRVGQNKLISKVKMQNFDSANPPEKKILEREFAAFYGNDFSALSECIENYLQMPAISLMPELENTLYVAKEAGAVASFLSGSGPSIVALVKNAEQQRDLALVLEALPDVNYCLRLTSALASETGLIEEV